MTSSFFMAEFLDFFGGMGRGLQQRSAASVSVLLGLT
jgi:hypothetical protein